MSSGPRTTARRRRNALALLAVLALALGIATTVLASLGAGERVTSLWIGATIADDGSARIVEVVDYDFGSHDRHGIYRDIPGLRASTGVEVTSPDAPADATVEGGFPPRVRIGDPDRTVSGQHRYVLRYTVDAVAPGGRLAWDAVGTGWEVDLDHVAVHVVAPAGLDGFRCVAGAAGSTDPCTLGQPEPGRLVTRIDHLDAGEGVTVYATAGTPVPAAALPDPPAFAAAESPGTSPALPGLLAGGLFLVVAVLVARLLRRAGRERVPAVGVPTLSAPGEEARIDLEELEKYATPSPTLPRGLTPAQGGVLHADGVRPEHKAAWLVDQAVAGSLELTGGERWESKDLTLVRLAPGDATAEPLLDRAFSGRRTIVLGRYDKDFAAAWGALGEELSAWRRASGLWDTAAERRTVLVRALGVLVGLVGAGLAALGGWLSANGVTTPLLLAAAGGALAGAGWAGAVRGWELEVLTPEGSALWLQVASLRQFLAQSPPAAIDEAVANGQLGTYTAWALALGQAQRWRDLASTTTVPGRARYYHDPYYRYALYSPVFVSSCSTASTAPSSSSSGGGGGGVGGGAGGGGGGSW